MVNFFNRHSLQTVLILIFLLGEWRHFLGVQYQEYEVKAAYIEKFTHFVEWPQKVLTNSDSVFVIMVLGKDPFGHWLDDVFHHIRVKGLRVHIVRTTRVQDVHQPQILFISASMEHQLSRILKRVRHKPVLTIGDSPGFGERGVMLNLVTQGGYVHFEANLKAIADSGLEVSSRLLKLAIIVEGDE